jgi:Ca2+-binding EF-hand superfamily protein
MKRAVTQLFNEIQTLDGISDNLVSKDELKVLLQKMNIFFSKSRFEAAFKLIDIDMSGTITLTEFIDFIFPDEAREVSYYFLLYYF